MTEQTRRIIALFLGISLGISVTLLATGGRCMFAGYHLEAEAKGLHRIQKAVRIVGGWMSDPVPAPASAEPAPLTTANAIILQWDDMYL